MSKVEYYLKDTVKVQDLGLLFKEKGVIVMLTFRGGQRTYTISPKAFGVKRERLSEESKEFLDKHVKNGSVTFIGKDDWKKVQSIKTKTWKQINKLAAGEILGNYYLTIESFLTFEKYFNKVKKEYMELRDSLVERYDEMLSRFKEIIRCSISDMEAHAAKAEYERIMNKLPSKKEFEESFSVEMHCFGMPTIEDLEGVSDELKEALVSQYKEIGRNLVTDITSTLINEAINTFSSVIKSGASNGRLHPKVIEGVKNSIKRIKRDNIFGNTKLDKIIKSMERLLTLDADSAVELSERLLVEAYNYSIELGLEEKVALEDCPFTREELVSMHQMYN